MLLLHTQFVRFSLLSQLTTSTKPQETIERLPEVSSTETPTLSSYHPSHLTSTSELMSNANDYNCCISAGTKVMSLSVLCVFLSEKCARLSTFLSDLSVTLSFVSC